jgi:hypothetical protein
MAVGAKEFYAPVVVFWGHDHVLSLGHRNPLDANTIRVVITEEGYHIDRGPLRGLFSHPSEALMACNESGPRT